MRKRQKKKNLRKAVRILKENMPSIQAALKNIRIVFVRIIEREGIDGFRRRLQSASRRARRSDGSLCLQVELGEFDTWTLEEGLTRKDKETLQILVDEIAVSLSEKGRR